MADMSGLMAAMSSKGKGKDKPAPDDEGDAEAEPTNSFAEYADDVFDALESGDKAGFKKALKKAVSACYAEE